MYQVHYWCIQLFQSRQGYFVDHLMLHQFYNLPVAENKPSVILLFAVGTIKERLKKVFSKLIFSQI